MGYWQNNGSEVETNRERHKSAPYLGLKIAQELQSVKYSVPKKEIKSWTELERLGHASALKGRIERATLSDFLTSIPLQTGLVKKRLKVFLYVLNILKRFKTF